MVNGLLDSIPVEQIVDWEKGFRRYLESAGGEVIDRLRTEKVITDEIETMLKQVIADYGASNPSH